jgi:hypothetical protein
MRADAELHLLVGHTARILYGDGGLYRDRTLDSVDSTSEIGDDTVARGVEDAAPMQRDQSVDDEAASLQPSERADLIARHQPAVTGNVGGKDRGEFAHYRMDGHAWLLPVRV